MLFVYTTVKDESEAVILSNNIIRERYAACADFWPIRSIYTWEGFPEDVIQYMVIFTTDENKLERLIEYIKKLHSYKVPMIGTSEINIKNVDYQLLMKNYLFGEYDRYHNDPKL